MPELPEFDGLIVEGPQGRRIIALPIAVIETLRYASAIRYRRGGRVWNLRLEPTTDGRQTGEPITQAQDLVQEHVRQAQEQAATNSGETATRWPTQSAPTPEYGAPALPVYGAQNPSPTPPPALEEDPADPADIPIYVKRGGAWTVTHVTRTEYERYRAQGRLSQDAPGIEQADEEQQ
jgi:hypothetical protein